MSQQIKNLKEHIQKAFADVESAEFLKVQVTKSRKKFSDDFVHYMGRFPESNFREWSDKLIAAFNIHTTVPSELQAIGISLLALDELEHEISDAYLKFKLFIEDEQN